MSKSLKNFIKIKEFTKVYSAKQLRFLFLLQKWNNIMNFDPKKSMVEALAKEEQFKEFFQQSKAIIRNFDIKKNPQKWSEGDRELNNKLREAKEKIHHHLCNNIDTPSVITELGSLMTETNRYMKNAETLIKSPLIVSISQYVLKISKCLGIVEEDPFGYGSSSAEADPETLAAPYVQAIVDFRDNIRKIAIKKNNKKFLFEE